MGLPRSDSYYTHSLKQDTAYPRLEGEQRVDVAIIGGGFTGVATALELCEKGFKVAIVEANKIGWGATGRNGGQVTGSLSGDKAMGKQFRKPLGAATDDFIWNLRWRGHDIIKKRVEKYNIECDLKHGHLQTAYKPSHIKELKQMLDQAQQNGMEKDVSWVSKEEIPNYLESSIYHGGLLNKRNMHLHALELCIGEARAAEGLGALIFEDSKVIDIKHGDQPQVITEHGKLTANTVLVAGNAYHRLERKKLRGMLFPVALGNCATAPLSEETAKAINPHNVAVYDSRFILDYYRLTADNRLLFGGGTNYSGYSSKSVANELRPSIEHTFPRLKGVEIEYDWTGMGGIVINRIPELGKTSKNVFYCQGFSGHGIATTHIMGEIMANAIAGNLEEFDLFAGVNHLRIPVNEWFGNQALAVGMLYYRMLEHFR